jgi:hypothetical protein
VELGNQGDLLLRVMGMLLDEMPDVGPVENTWAESPFRERAVTSERLSTEDKLLVESLRAALATIAARLSADADAENASAPFARAALDAAETVMRGELMTRRDPQLARLLPSLVFVVALPIVDQDRALALSQRTLELIEEQIEAI